MPDHYKILPWDSEFFNIKVAEVEKNSLAGAEKEKLYLDLAEEGVELAYYTADAPVEEEVDGPFSFHLVNKKAPLIKYLSKTSEFHKNISLFKGSVPTSELISLSYRAGDHSRFSSDPNLDSAKVKTLYELWITKSVQKEMADEVLVYILNNKIEGFITLRFRGLEGQTPLFAVSKEAEGKGVSFALMRAADSVLLQNGCTFCTSATQADNRAAVTVFKRHGCEIKPVEYVYHLWKK